MTASGIILAVVFVSLLIVVHEGGHFLVARWCGMRVLRFSLGFGKPLVKWERGGTIYQIASVPLGGFVQIAGMNPHEEVDPEDPAIYPNRPAWQRMLTIAAGPVANYLCASILVFVYFMAFGMPTQFKPGIAMVVAKSAAAKAGVQERDLLVSIDGKAIAKADEVLPIVRASDGRPMVMVVKRAGQELTLTVTPEKQKVGYRIGVLPAEISTARRAAAFGESAWESVRYPAVQSVNMLGGLYLMIRGKIKAEVSGPVGIVKAVAQTTKSGAEEVLQIIATISIALGLFNLLPVPALDGGRLVFLGVEVVSRRRVRPTVEAAVHTVGFMLLLGLLVFVTFKDIQGCFPGK
ncbi:MAG: site-2 protease family protein [Deltaproteobacteria bacterium]|nr:site-2 protease family protein [Deltaproteobacteria bacterium]